MVYENVRGGIDCQPFQPQNIFFKFKYHPPFLNGSSSVIVFKVPNLIYSPDDDIIQYSFTSELTYQHMLYFVMLHVILFEFNF